METVAEEYYLKIDQSRRLTRLFLRHRGRDIASLILAEDEVERMIERLREAVKKANAPMRRPPHTFKSK